MKQEIASAVQEEMEWMIGSGSLGVGIERGLDWDWEGRVVWRVCFRAS